MLLDEILSRNPIMGRHLVHLLDLINNVLCKFCFVYNQMLLNILRIAILKLLLRCILRIVNNICILQSLIQALEFLYRTSTSYFNFSASSKVHKIEIIAEQAQAWLLHIKLCTNLKDLLNLIQKKAKEASFTLHFSLTKKKTMK